MSEPIPTTAADVWRLLLAAKRETDTAIAQYEEAIRTDAQAADAARKAKARAYVQGKAQIGGKATVPEITAYVDLETANDQTRADISSGMKNAAKLRVESARGWMSAIQSAAALAKAEAQIATWEPRETQSA